MRNQLFPIVAAAALLVALVLPAGGLAARPVEGPGHFTFTDSFPDSICGIAGTSVVNGRENFALWADGTFQDTLGLTQVFTATASGKSAEIQVAVHTTGSLDPIDNGDGTISFVNTKTGLPEKLSIANGPVLSRDAGAVTFTFVWDPVTGIPLYETLSGLHGPHPDLTSGFSVFCDVLVSALT